MILIPNFYYRILRDTGFALEGITFLFKEIFLSALRVSWQVISWRPVLNSGIVRIHTELATNLEQTIQGNCITLTPGTMTLDARPDIKPGTMFIHFLNIKNMGEEVYAIEEGFERRIRRFNREFRYAAVGLGLILAAVLSVLARIPGPAAVSGAVDGACDFSIGVLFAGIMLLFIRLVLGPTMPDRVLAGSTISAGVGFIAMILALQTGQKDLLLVPFVLYNVNWYVTCAFAQYMLHGRVFT